MKTKLLLTVISGFLIFFACKKYEVVQKDVDNPDGMNIRLMRAIHYGDSIVLLWSDDTPSRKGFKIYRKDPPDGSFSQLAEVNKTTLRYTDFDVEDTDSLIYYVEVYGDGFSIQSNQVASSHYQPSANQPPTPEYYIVDGHSQSYSIDYSGETDVFCLYSSPDDLDIEITNIPSTMDIAVKIWDSTGNYLGIFNYGGQGVSEYIYNVGYAIPYIFEIYSFNNQIGSYYLYVY